MMHSHHPDWGSHIPMLIALLDKTRGPVLELGLGISSTPLLHMLCADRNRELVSYENEPKFIEMFRKYQTKDHAIRLVEDWDKIDISQPWSVALVDHKPDGHRYLEAQRLTQAAYVILHDSQPEATELYHYDLVYPLFKHRFDYTKFPTHTTVLSNFNDLSWL